MNNFKGISSTISKDFLKVLIDNSHFGGLLINENRVIEYANENIIDIFDYSIDEIINKKTDILYSDRRKDSTKKEIYLELEKNGFHKGKAKGKTSYEEDIDLNIYTFLIKPNKGAIIFIDPINQFNLSNLPDENHFLHNLLDNIPDMVYFKDKNNKFVLVNKAHSEALNLNPKQIVGKSDLDFFPEELAKTFFEDDNNVMQSGIPIIGKITKAKREDGGYTYISTTKVPHYDENGNIIGTMGITRNITDLMVAQEELRIYKNHLEETIKERTKELKEKNEKLLKMYNLKSDFTSAVSHELRTPLTAMRESINIILEEETGPINEEQKEFLDLAKKNVDRLSRLINDVLDFQKLEAGKTKFSIKSNNINDVAKEVQASMLSLAKKKNLELKLDTDEKISNINFDKDKIIQVITNLVNNALKFTETGSITIKTQLQENKILVSIEDTGCGIKEEDIPKLFQRFEQVEKGSTRKPGGTGLGLAISKEIIKQHKGDIWIESIFNEGSKFFFFIPTNLEEKIDK